MDVSSFPGKLDELAGQKITKLVFTYDRAYMHPRLLDSKWRFSLKTTEMPLSVLVYAQKDLLAKYSFKPPHVSGYTWRIKFSAHPEFLSTILRKALTPNGPKHYTFKRVRMDVPDEDIYLAHSLYRTIKINWWLNMEPTELKKYEKPGKGCRYLIRSDILRKLDVHCAGRYEGFWDKVRVLVKLNKIKRQRSK